MYTLVLAFPGVIINGAGVTIFVVLSFPAGGPPPDAVASYTFLKIDPSIVNC